MGKTDWDSYSAILVLRVGEGMGAFGIKRIRGSEVVNLRAAVKQSNKQTNKYI